MVKFSRGDWEVVKEFRHCLENNVLAAIRTNHLNQIYLIGVTRGAAQLEDIVRGRVFVPASHQTSPFDPVGTLYDIDPRSPNMMGYTGKRSQLGFKAASLASVKELRITASPEDFVEYLKECYLP